MILDLSISVLKKCHFCRREKGTFKRRHGIQKRSWDAAWAPNTWASASLPWSSVPPPLTMGSSGEVFCPAGPCPPLPCHSQSHTRLRSILPRTRHPPGVLGFPVSEVRILPAPKAGSGRTVPDLLAHSASAHHSRCTPPTARTPYTSASEAPPRSPNAPQHSPPC